VLYASPQHRGRPRALEPVVATRTVRCARGTACLRAELVDGVPVGGLILPGEPWQLGHPDGESVGGPEHRRCNVGARAAPAPPGRAQLVSVREGMVMVWGFEAPAFSIGWMEPLGAWDSGFTVIFQMAPLR
jgi:hypothetical protein